MQQLQDNEQKTPKDNHYPQNNEQKINHKKKKIVEAVSQPIQSKEFDFGEVFSVQLVETIEFVIGSISNTASYLRLWALSFAHSQLSKVFFEKTIGIGIMEGSAVKAIVGWFIFFNITIIFMMAIDLLECFLHALRLQWVEFQGKFFHADGVLFNSFSFYGNLRGYSIQMNSNLHEHAERISSFHQQSDQDDD